MEEEQRRVPAEVQVDGMRLWLYDGVEEYLRPPQSEAVLARRAPELRAWLDELRARVPLRVYLAIGRGQQRGTALVVVRGGTRSGSRWRAAISGCSTSTPGTAGTGTTRARRGTTSRPRSRGESTRGRGERWTVGPDALVGTRGRGE